MFILAKIMLLGIFFFPLFPGATILTLLKNKKKSVILDTAFFVGEFAEK